MRIALYVLAYACTSSSISYSLSVIVSAMCSPASAASGAGAGAARDELVAEGYLVMLERCVMSDDTREARRHSLISRFMLCASSDVCCVIKVVL